MKSAFLLQHVARRDSDDEDVKVIGVFSTKEKAEAAVSSIREQPGLRDYPTDFEISEYKLDQSWWTDGFITDVLP